MSLVGPRPIVPAELGHYGSRGAQLLADRPGVFGEWTSRGSRRPNYPQRARIELEYLQTRSITRDLAILLRSVPVIMRGHVEP